MKFEMNRYTLDKLMSLEYVTINIGLVEHKYSFHGTPIVINTNKPDGIVQLGRDSIDLTYTDNIRGSLESLVYAAKRREGGRIHFGPGGAFSVRSKETPERASGRTFRALLDVMKTASESPEGSLTLFVVLNDNAVYSSYSLLNAAMGQMLGNVLNDNKAKTLRFENRTIQVVSKDNMNFTNHSFGKGKRINVVYDHTVQRGE